jgi:type I restriction-modification system DNA methylase subunit
MALMFQRLARNFVKDGYFPTDEATMAGIASALDVAPSSVRILDPCCGEGTALAEVKHHLG